MSAGAIVASSISLPLFSGSVPSPPPLGDPVGGTVPSSSSPLALPLLFTFVLIVFSNASGSNIIWFIRLMKSAGNRFRKCTIIEASNSGSSVNSLNPRKYWVYGFSAMYSTTSRSGNPVCAWMYSAPNAILPLIPYTPLSFEKFCPYTSSMASQGSISDCFTQRLFLLSFPLNCVLKPSKYC
jgi:hypothetical protein